MSLHDELHAQYVAQPKVSHREYDDFLVEEIGRLRAELKSAVESKQMLVLDNAELCSENRKIGNDLLMVRQQKNELIARLSPEQPKLPEGVSVLPKCALCERQAWRQVTDTRREPFISAWLCPVHAPNGADEYTMHSLDTVRWRVEEPD
jgi:hypothetical protein